jgi:hypothetical protein
MNKYKYFGLLLTVLFIVASAWVSSIDYIIIYKYYFGSVILILLLIAVLKPIILKPFYIVWMFIGHWLGLINTYLVFTIIYFIVITPISLISRLFSKKRINANWVDVPFNEQTDFSKQY